MKTLVLWRLIPIVTIALALSSQGVAQSSSPSKIGGLIQHYTAALDANGPWFISGEWSVWAKGNSGKADFSAVLNMIRSDNATRQPHTHHVTMVDGEFALTGTGFAVSGVADVTSNGNLVFAGVPVEIEVTGGTAVAYSNVLVRFTGGGALNHFGAEPLTGVVTPER